MKCPFCGEEIEPVEAASARRVERRCPNCQSLVAAYRKGMEQRLNNLVSLDRFKESAK
ncbi:hypothetical protein ACFLWG_02550 [Chloroflexota bacterium]